RNKKSADISVKQLQASQSRFAANNHCRYCGASCRLQQSIPRNHCQSKIIGRGEVYRSRTYGTVARFNPNGPGSSAARLRRRGISKGLPSIQVAGTGSADPKHSKRELTQFLYRCRNLIWPARSNLLCSPDCLVAVAAAQSSPAGYRRAAINPAYRCRLLIPGGNRTQNLYL